MSGLDRRFVLVFVDLLRCGRLPFASQLGRLGLLRHGADIGQTQLRLLRRESRAAVLPPPLVLLGKSHELRSCLPLWCCSAKSRSPNMPPQGQPTALQINAFENATDNISRLLAGQ